MKTERARAAWAILRGVLAAAGGTLVGMTLLATAVIYLQISDAAITAINQVLKVVCVLLGARVAVGVGGKRGFGHRRVRRRPVPGHRPRPLLRPGRRLRRRDHAGRDPPGRRHRRYCRRRAGQPPPPRPHPRDENVTCLRQKRLVFVKYIPKKRELRPGDKRPMDDRTKAEGK